jgi:uncharacterized protein (DUF4415 family)
MPEYMTLRNGRRVVLNTDEEEATVNAGIDADEDTHEVTEAGFEVLRPAGETGAAEEPVVVYLPVAVVDVYRAKGEDWRKRLDADLSKWLAEQAKEAGSEENSG